MGMMAAFVDMKRRYVFQPMVLIQIGVISTTIKLQIQNEADAAAAPFWRIRRVHTPGA